MILEAKFMPVRWMSLIGVLLMTLLLLTGGLPSHAITRLQDLGQTDLIPGSDNYYEHVAVDSSANKTYISGYGGIRILDGATGLISTKFDYAYSTAAIAVNTTTHKVYAVGSGYQVGVLVFDSDVSTFDTVSVSNAKGIAVNSTTNRIYVTQTGGSDSNGKPIGNSVTVINGDDNSIVATVPVGVNPDGVAVNPTTNKIYVSNDGDNSSTARTFTVIDGATNTAVTVNLPDTSALGLGYGTDIAVNPSRNRIYVTMPGNANTHGTQVAVINGDDNSVLNLVTVGNDPTSIAVNPSNNKVYVGNLNYFRDTVNNRVFYGLSIFDGSDDSVTTSSTYNLTRIGTPYDVAVNSSTGNVYVAQDGVLSVISSSGLTMVPLFSEPRGVAVNPNTNKIYITNDQSSSAVGVHVVDGTTGQVIKNIAFYPNPDFNLSNAPYGIAVNTQLNQIYVTLPSAGQLVRIDGATDTIIDSVTVDMLVSRTVDSDGTIHETYSTDHPSGIAFNPVTNTIYVTNNGSSYPSLSVIHVNGDGTLNVDRTLHPAGVAPLGVAVDTSTDKVYVGCTVNSKVALKVIKGSTYDNAAYTEEATLPFSYGNGYQVPDPAGVAVNSATHQVYLADGQQLQVIDGTNNTVTTAIPFSNNSSFQYYGAGVAINEADNRVYVSASSSLSGALIAISGATNQVLSQIGGADSSSSYGGAFNLAFNPQTKRIYTVGYSGYYAGSSGGLMQTAFDGIDSTPPTVTVNQPYADNGYGGGFYHSTGTVDSGALLQATGTSQDVRSDVTSVKVKLHRDARDTTPAGWWAGGSTWTSTYSDAANLLSATLSDNGNYNNNRNWTFTLPTVIQGFTDATYTLTAVSSDEVGNVGTSDAVNFQIDNTAPTITITQPQDGHSYLNSDAAVRTIKGTAADDLNGSGIASDYDYSSGQGVSKPQLHIRLTRGADAQHQNQLWSGSANQDGSPYYYDLSQTPAYDSINYYPAFFGTANQDGSVNWSKALPPLDAGVYTLRVLTKDKAGNDGQSTTVTFTVTLPALTLSINPTSFSKNAGANAATGTVSIPAALTGDLTVQLFSNNSNVASVPDSVKITAGQLSTTFTVAAHNDGFPGDSPITIQATATGYSEATADVTATGSSGGGGDTTPPTFSITDPANNSSVTSLAVTKGTATDNVGVAGLSINFYNANTQQYWNGTSWVASYYSFPVTGVGTDGSWTFANGPDASKLIPGTYYVSVNGYDTSFNNSFAQNLVKVVAATQPPTSATLSIAPATFSEAAGANAATATLTLDKPAVSDMTFLLAINVPGALSLPLQNGTPAVTVAAGNNSVTFPIGAVDNSVADGARNVILSASCGSISANQTVTLTDNDTAGLVVTPTTGLQTTEAGGTANFTVKLSSQPLANVTINLSSSNPNEGTVAPATLTFTPANWNAAQPVTVTGVADHIADGDQAYTVKVAPSSSDATYNGLAPVSVGVTNKDVDVAKLTLALSVNDALVDTVTEGQTITGTVTRNTPFTSELTVNLTSSNPAIPVPGSVVIHAGQTLASFTINTTDDAIAQGDRSTTITATAGALSDSKPLTVKDNDGPTLTLSIAPTTFAENGTTTGTLTRNTSTDAALAVTVASSDTSVATVSSPVTIPAGQSSVTFTITGVSDGKITGSRTTNISAVAGALSAVPVTVTATETDKLPVPTISSVSPASAPMGATVTINGTNLQDATVKFGAAAATVNTATSTATKLVTTVPTGLAIGSVLITVQTAGGTATKAFTVIKPTTYTITGTVKTKTGAAVTGTKVGLLKWTGKVAPTAADIQNAVLDFLAAPTTVKPTPVTVDSKTGAYTFTGLAIGTYIVAPYKAGTSFISNYVVKTLTTNSVETINFVAGAGDTTKPTVTVTKPTGNATFTKATLPAATGAATDSSGILGVGVVLAKINSLSLSGLNLSLYNWNTNAFDAAVTVTTANLNNVFGVVKPANVKAAALSGSTWTTPLPLTLGVGNYRVIPFAVDKAFNIGYPVPALTGPTATMGNFRIATSTGTRGEADVPIASPLQLSTGTASAAKNGVTLRFLGALESETASDAAHYAVQVNGQAVTVESAGYDGTAHSVILGLPDGTLHSGDQVTVAWSDLLDEQGRIVSGQTGPLAAK